MGTEGVEPEYIKTEVLPEFFKCFWNRRMALDRWVEGMRRRRERGGGMWCKRTEREGGAPVEGTSSLWKASRSPLLAHLDIAYDLAHILFLSFFFLRRNYKALVETTVELANKVGSSEIVSRVVEDLKVRGEGQMGLRWEGRGGV